MKGRSMKVSGWVWMVLMAGVAAVAWADGQAEAPKVIQWQGTDIQGQALQVPDAGGLTLVVFAKVDQERTYKAMKQIVESLGDSKDVKPIAIISGPGSADAAKRVVKDTNWPYAIAADPDYKASGTMSARVWPTTVLIAKDGKQIVHLGGITSAYAKELDAYLAYGRGQIDADQLKLRLESNDVVASSPHQIAARHLEVAKRLIAQRQPTQARDELAKALQSQPGEPRLLAELARVQVMLNEPAAAISTLDKIDASQMPPWQLNGIRGRALIALDKWTEARQALENSLQLNPDPAEAHFYLAQVCAHEGQWEQAATHYRAAFEHTDAAKHLGITPQKRQTK